jgi:hypothetical protein
MAKSQHAFTALNAGELSPLLEARVDKEFYGVGLKTCSNMIPLTQGPAAMRSGTQYVKAVRNSANRTALIRFQFGLTQAYAIEVGDQYFRFYKDHAIITQTATNITGITKANPGVVTSNSHGLSTGDRVIISGVGGMVELNNREFLVNVLTANTFQLGSENTSSYTTYTSGGTVAKIVEVSTPYTQVDLFDSAGVLQLSYSQSADTLYIVHPSYAPRKLTRSSHTSWSLSTVTFTGGPFAQTNADDSKWVFVDTTSSYDVGTSVTLRSNSAIFESGHVGGLFFMEEVFYADGFGSGDVLPWQAAGTDGSTGQLKTNDGNVYENARALATTLGNVAPTHTIGEAWDGSNPTFRSLWRYRHSHWCVLEITAYTSSTQVTATVKTFLCHGLSRQPTNISNCVNNGAGAPRITHASHGYATNDYVLIENVGGTTGANGSWQITVTGTNTYDLIGATFNAAWTGGGRSRRYATWKWAFGAFSSARGYPSAVAFHEDRLCFAATTSDPDTVWMSEASSYEAFSPRDANQITAANSITVTMSSGEVNKIEAMQGTPDGLLVFTADSESLIAQASTNEPLGPGNVRAVALSNYGVKDVKPVRVGGATMFIQRGGRKVREFIQTGQGFEGNDLLIRAEHLTAQYGVVSMDFCQEPDAILWCARSDGKLLSFTYQKEQNVLAWCQHTLGGYSDSGNTLEPVIESVCQVPNSDGSYNELWLVVKRYVNGATVRYIEYLKPRWIRGTDVSDGFFVDCGLTYDGSAVSTISGLNWLRGQTVTILADGKVHATKTVSASGTVTLDYTASTVHVGLGYVGRVQFPRPEAQQPDGTAQGKDKQVKKVAVRLLNTNNLKFGPSFTNMARVEFRRNTDPIDQAVPLMDGDKRFDFNALPGDGDGYICLEQDYPYPFCVVGAFATLEVY